MTSKSAKYIQKATGKGSFAKVLVMFLTKTYYTFRVIKCFAVEYSFSKRIVRLTLKYNGRLHWPFQYQSMVTYKSPIKKTFRAKKILFDDSTFRGFSKIA